MFLGWFYILFWSKALCKSELPYFGGLSVLFTSIFLYPGASILQK